MYEKRVRTFLQGDMYEKRVRILQGDMYEKRVRVCHDS